MLKMLVDDDYHKRLERLGKLMLLYPDKPVTELQHEALKLFPLHCEDAIQAWMKIDTAFRAADLLENK
jgi:hypothetical protein